MARTRFSLSFFQFGWDAKGKYTREVCVSFRALVREGTRMGYLCVCEQPAAEEETHPFDLFHENETTRLLSFYYKFSYLLFHIPSLSHQTNKHTHLHINIYTIVLYPLPLLSQKIYYAFPPSLF